MATVGVLVMMQQPSKEMRLEATRANFLSGSTIPRLQLLTVEEIFKGGAIKCFGVSATVMPKPALPERKADDPQLNLKLEPRKPPTKTKGKKVVEEEVAVPSSRRAGSRR